MKNKNTKKSVNASALEGTGASHIRVAGKIAKQLGIPVRDFLRHVETYRSQQR
ncbi:hypothetical protein ACKP2L_05240 [Oenococcus alcoholitolerans]|uniref:hypothetical protein n=1 Tax=Oenococcus alcoholitolerans TaxID=931074 RepID=UPI003F6E9E0D